MTDPRYEQWAKFLGDSMNVADDIVHHYYQQRHLSINEKENKTLVTQADLEIETEIRKQIKASFPEWGILGEEHGEEVGSSGVKFIIDPIDGTYNFVRGIPFFGSLFAIEEDGEVVLGAVSCSILEERWTAAKGQGTFYSKQTKEKNRCEVSQVNTLPEAQAFHGSLYGFEAEGVDQGPLLSLLKQTQRQRGFGDIYPHMLVAMGCGEFAVDVNVKPWDIAPIKIIVEEAGGKVSDIRGENSIYSGSIISSNGNLHQQVISGLSI